MGIVVILGAIIIRVIQQIYFFNTRNDMTYQVLGMQHLLEGNGISFASLNSSDISSVIYHPLNKWPPGYSILLVPFYLLCGKNYILAALMLGITCSALLIFVTRGILRLSGVPYHLINLFTCITGFFSYYFYTIPCTDAAGVSFLITALYFALRILKSKMALKSNVLLLCLSLVTAGFIKYLFIPAIVVIPAFLLAKGYLTKTGYLKKAGLISFIFLIAVFGSYFVWQKTGTGEIGYIREAQRGFYPENLKAAFPFITGAVTRPDTITKVFPETANTGKDIFIVFQVLTLVFFVPLAAALTTSLIKNSRKKVPVSENFISLSFLISLALIVLLVYLSLRVGKENFEFGKWTYIQEPRYYGAIIIFIHLGFFIFYSQQQPLPSRIRVWMFGLVLLLMTPEIMRGITFTAGRIVKCGVETFGWQQELGFQKKADAIITKIKGQQPENIIVLAGTSDWMVLRIALYSHLPAFTNADLLLKPDEIKSSKPAILLAIIADDKKELYKSFISLKSVKEEGEGNGFRFYSLPVNP